jgi:endo-1,4-beta-xylanase
MQMHNQVNFPSPDEVSRAAQKIVDRQFQVYFSEWDISFNQLKNKTVLTDDMKEQQKYLIKTMVKGFKQLPAKFRHGISFWGVGDADSWIRPQFSRTDWPLLYDDNYKPKPAYCGFIEAINEPL